MIFVGIDDTDTPDTPGTNQLARALVARLSPRYRLVRITRHQLLFDPRVPYTSKNGSASILLEPQAPWDRVDLLRELCTEMCARFNPGSDPGLCLTESVAPAVRDFGRRCQRELIRQSDARALAANHAIHLEGLGGTEDGVIGALAAVGLAVDGDDGRVVQLADWPDDLCGPQEAATIHARGIEIRVADTGQVIDAGTVDVGKHLRPNCRHGKIVLFVQPQSTATWEAVRLP
jgi:tRNA(Ile2) C34 agmatinyltransferase TiaS